MKTKPRLAGRAYGTDNLPEDRATHTLTIKLPRSLHMEVLELVEDGEFVSMADFYRAAAREMLLKIKEAEQ